MAVPDPKTGVPESELTLLDPVRGRIVTRSGFASAHLAEGIAAVPGRAWALAPLVNVRNLIPITQVANGWVMSSSLAVAERSG
jgi:hypothetical protein